MEGTYVLEATGLGKSFGGFVAVKDVNLSVKRGSIHALIGPNGAGKSTLFNLLTKFLIPTTGAIRFRGEDITGSTSAAIARKGLARSFQISAVFPHMTVLENVRVALLRKQCTNLQFWRSERSLKAYDARALTLLEAVNLAEYRDRVAAELPYGRKRALEIAATLALDPEMLLLDEPMAGMGHEDIDRTADLIAEIGKSRTILMVEHNLSVVSNLSDRITVLQRGAVLTEGTYAEVSSDTRVREAYMGGADA